MGGKRLGKVQIFSDGGEASRRQLDVVKRLGAGFPLLEVEVLPAGGEKAEEAGILVPPGVVIEGLTLSIGTVLEAEELKRYLLGCCPPGSCGEGTCRL